LFQAGKWADGRTDGHDTKLTSAFETFAEKNKNENLFYEKKIWIRRFLILREGIIERERNKELGFPSSVPLRGISPH